MRWKQAKCRPKVIFRRRRFRAVRVMRVLSTSLNSLGLGRQNSHCVSDVLDSTHSSVLTSPGLIGASRV